MTKAAKILELYANGMTVRAIAETVGCRPEYVRVVARQRMGSTRSENDIRYLSSSLHRDTRRKLYPAKTARMRAVKSALPKEDANAVGRDAYNKAIRSGASVREATNARAAAIYRAAAAVPGALQAGRDAYADIRAREVSP